MRLTQREVNKIRSKGIKSSGFLSVGKKNFIDSLQYNADEFLKDEVNVNLDIFGLRQVPSLSGKPVGDGFFGVYLTSDIEDAARYSLGIINDTPIRKGERAYVFVIEIKKSEIHQSLKQASMKKFVFKSGKIYHWLDIVIPKQRIVHIFDLGERDISFGEREKILKRFLDNQLANKIV